ncbi:MAG TPA: cytochrome c3 family protein [Firmicutes bacterium]|nr:cytochrome c3 family protein [Bacillota bacterium]
MAGHLPDSRMKGAGFLLVASVFALLLTNLHALGAQYSQPTIVGSKHDLAWSYHRVSEGFHPWDDYNQVCVFCHAPHHADQSQGPLWNRQAPTGPYTLYQSPTLVGSPENPGPSSLLCLSCHDGTLAVDLVINRPLYGIGTTTTKHGAMTTAGTDSWLNCGTYCHKEGGSWHDATLTYLSTDMSNDHPVGIVYPNSPKLVAAPPGGKFANGVRLVNNRVECVSCHNPHNPVNRPFLVTSDANSALCYTCHLK